MINYLTGFGYNAIPNQEITVKNEIITIREEIDMIPLDFDNDSDLFPGWENSTRNKNIDND